MHTRLLTIILLFPLLAAGQQLPNRSIFGENSFIWNPAMTASYNYWEASAAYRMQWLGFDDAPSTTAVGIEYPFIDYNMSMGGYFMLDKIGPLRTNTIAMTYSYKFELGISPGDRLSLGIMANMNQHFIDGIDFIVNDPDDILIPTGENTKFQVNAGFGIFYTSESEHYFDDSYFFFGMAANQVLPTNLIFDETGGTVNLKRAIHANAIIGGRFINDGIMFEPSAWFNYSEGGVFDITASVRMESYDKFWTGLAYGSNQTFNLQLGYILAEGFLEDSTLRIGTLGTLNMSDKAAALRGFSFGFYMGFRYEL